MGNHITERGEPVRGVRAKDPYRGPSMNPTKYGNEIAAATVAKPGGSRNIYRTGFQGQHGSVNPGNPRPNAQRHALDNK
jgi:hypothetical protein